MIAEQPVVDYLTFQVWDPQPHQIAASTVIAARTSANSGTEALIAGLTLPVRPRDTVTVALSVATSMSLNGVVKSGVLRLRDGTLDGPVLASHTIPDTGDRTDGAADTWVWSGTIVPTGRALVVSLQSANNARPDMYVGARSLTTAFTDWRDLADRATTVTIKRGGEQRGPSTAVQVGTLDATLVGALNLSADTALRPNAPIRVVRKGKTSVQLWNVLGGDLASTGIGVKPWPTAGIVGATTVASGATTLAATGATSSPIYDLSYSAGKLFATTEPTFDTSNRLPSNLVPGRQYVVRATARDNATAGGSARVKLVAYTGDRIDPRIIAEGAPRAVSTTATDFADLTFTAPTDRSWNLGIAFADDLSGPGNVASAQSMTLTRFEVVTPIGDRPEFTGVIDDIYQDVDLDKANNTETVYTTIAASDAVRELANTTRYGVVANSGAGFQDFASRVQQLATSSPVPITTPSTLDTSVYRWSGLASDPWTASSSAGNTAVSYSNLPSAIARYSRPAGNTNEVTFLPRLVKTFRNLQPGTTYGFRMTLALGDSNLFTPGDFQLRYLDGKNAAVLSDSFTFGAQGESITIGLSFVATTTIATLGVVGGTTMSKFSSGAGTAFGVIAMTDAAITRVGDLKGYQLADVAYESSLASHLDLACNSVGGYWWVGKDGRTIVTRQIASATAPLTIADTTAGDVSYTDVALAYDTRNVVNVLDFNQHGRVPATGNADDSSYQFTSDVSIRRWGARAGTVDTCLYLGGVHAVDLTRRAQELMSGNAQPVYAIPSLTMNAQSNTDLLELVDVRAPVRVRYKSIDQTARVLAVTHRITPTRWLVDLQFNEIRAGKTFADFTAMTTGTFADFTTAWAGKTYTDFNAS